MGLFGKKKQQDASASNTEVTADEKKMIERLCSHAGNVIAMLKGVLSGPNGTDLYVITLFAAGLAGIACHEAVKELGAEQVVVEGQNGKKYYMGDAVNKYLHENKYSVTNSVRAVTEMPEEALISIVAKQAQTIGSDNFVVAGNMDPGDFYKNVKNCWDGIKNNMTLEYCEKPEEWPVFYGIVLQNVVAEAMKIAPKEAIFNTAVDVACAMSKMDAESI